MTFVLGDFVVTKLSDILWRLGGEKIATQEHVVRLLKKFGYEKLEDSFESIYVHALVRRRLSGTPTPMLQLFKVHEVVAAFHRAWQEQGIASTLR